MNANTLLGLILIAGTLFGSFPAFGQTPAAIVGEWRGDLHAGATSLPLVLHLRVDPAGALQATLDSPAQGAYGLGGTNVVLRGRELSFDVPSVHGAYKGMLKPDGKTLTGTWTQAVSLPLELRQTTSAADLAQVKPSPIDGDWTGVLRAGAQSLRLAFHFRAAPGGNIGGSLDSIDQGAMEIPCANIKLEGQKLTLEVPSVHGTYEATLSGDKLSGTWNQGQPLPLDVTRQAKRVRHGATPAPAGPPVALKDLPPLIDREFAPVIAAWPERGVVVGILDHGERQVLAYGTAKPDSIFVAPQNPYRRPRSGRPPLP